MKTVIGYEVFYFLKLYIFQDLIILNALYQKYIANKTLEKFTKQYFTLWFCNLLKNGKKKKKADTFLGKKNRTKTKKCYHNDICRLKRDNSFSEVEITREIV